MTDASPATQDRTLPDGGQRSPTPGELLLSLRSVVVRLPGMVTTTGTYLSQRPHVDHVVVDCTGDPGGPDPDRPMAGDPATLLRRRDGRGPLYRRVYRVEVDDARTGPEEIVRSLLTDPNRAAPTEIARFEAVSGDREVGAEFAVRLPGPWDAPVRVVERTPTSFRYATLRGHMEAGELEFRASWGEGGRLVFEVESWSRSADRLYHWLHHRVPITRELQLHMWVHVCRQVVSMAGGRAHGSVQVTTSRWKDAA